MAAMRTIRNTIATALLVTGSAASAAGLVNHGAAMTSVADIGVQAQIDIETPLGAANHLIQQTRASGDVPDMTAAEAARKARRQFGGKVLSVSQAGSGQDVHFNVRLLKDGNVRVVRIPIK